MTSVVQQDVKEFEQRGASRKLVVAVHAFTYNRQRLRDMLDIVKDKLPDADILTPEYSSGLFSNVDLCKQAIEIVRKINQQDKERMHRPDGQSYKQIILIGHSLGALLIRMVYLIARGYAPDSEYSRIGLKLNVEGDWYTRVERLILFAGMNRGWSLEKRPDYMSWPKYLFCRLLLLVEWLLPSDWGRMILSARRGTPFVVNLRLQWLRLERQTPHSFPVTIQLIGENDTMVKADSVDPESGSNFIYKDMRKAGHLNIVRFTPRQSRGWWKRCFEYFFGPWRINETSEDLEKRKETFVEVLTKDKEELQSDWVPKELKIDYDVKHAVLIMHGIRDRGNWTSSIATHLKKLGNDRRLLVKSQNSSYGYFPMLRFLLKVRRQENVRKLADWYTQFVALYPNAKIGFFGHSNGTYLAASLLDRYDYELIKFDNIVFAGSVVACNYRWQDKLAEGCVNNLCNILAHADWVVAWFPRLFEMFANQDGSQPAEIGSAGFNGFNERDEERIHEIAYLKGGHDAGIKKEIHEAIAKFILDGPPMIINNPESKVGHRSWWVDQLSKFCWVVWLGLATLIIYIGMLFVKFMPLILLNFFEIELNPLFAVFIYIGLVLVILLQV